MAYYLGYCYTRTQIISFCKLLHEWKYYSYKIHNLILLSKGQKLYIKDDIDMAKYKFKISS
jgi:hypothetical protein